MIYKKPLNQFVSEYIDSKVENNINNLLSTAEKRHLKKYEILADLGNYTNGSYYVDKGILKMYQINNDGKEQIIQFASESWYIQLNESAIFKKPNCFIIQAIEDCVVYIIDFKETRDLMLRDPHYMDFVVKLYSSQLLQAQERITMLLKSNNIEKYQHFLKVYPELVNRISSTDISAYLGIAKESFSRLKKQL